MPPRLPYGAASHSRITRVLSKNNYSSSCLICQLFRASAHKPSLGRKRIQYLAADTSRIRRQSTQQYSNGAPELSITSDPAEELKAALLDLQKHGRSYINISRLQLALRGLEQGAGQETIRIAVLGLSGPGETGRKVRELVRLLVADPLTEEEEWERQLLEEQHGDRPVLLRIGGDHHDGDIHAGTVRVTTTNPLMRELTVASPTLKDHKLEILVFETAGLPVLTDVNALADAILVPTLDIPTSNTGRYTPVTTPVHKAIVIGDGIMGAASLVNLSGAIDPEVITSAANLPGQSREPGCQAQTQNSVLPFQLIDIPLAREALYSFRESIDNAISYEHRWFDSNLPILLEWIKAGTAKTPDIKAMKPSVYALISTLLTDASHRIQVEQAQQLSTLLSSKVPASSLRSLSSDLQVWAEKAHTELRDELDFAFAGRRWRKLGWWKLFWRVDDVSMIASDILNQRFLPEAERSIIHLSGKLEQAGVQTPAPLVQLLNNTAATSTMSSESSEVSPPSKHTHQVSKSLDEVLDAPVYALVKQQPWPMQIPRIRAGLDYRAVPALQALGQKLVLQTLSTSGFASAFSALIYVSTVSTSLYEAGAVAAFGIVWSLRRMQKKWETARAFWEDEVREEGRRAVRDVETFVATRLREPETGVIESQVEIEAAKNAVERAEMALKRMNSL